MQIEVITLFPEMFSALEIGITGRAIKNGLVTINYWNPRHYAPGPHHHVDDRPYGGGPGMVMRVAPLQETIRLAKQATDHNAKVIYLSPQGKRFDQTAAKEFAAQDSLVLVAGRYEGIDERIIETSIDEEWSIGDYVLTGGELAIMVIIDSITRLLPGALGDEHSALQDSFATGLLDHPHYTRPFETSGLKVPDVLLSGDHQAIANWRLKQALGRTWLRRPDMLESCNLTQLQQKLLKEFIIESNDKS